MNTIYSLAHIYSVLEDLIDKAYQLLQQQNIYKKVPYFMHQQCMNIIYQMQGVQAPVSQKNKIVEQNQKAVPKLQKDSLMPKEIESDKLQKQVSKNISNKNSSLKSKNQSRLRKTQQQLNLNSSLRSVSLINKKAKSKIQSPLSRYEPLLNEEEINDPQINKYRDMTQIRLKYENQYKNMILQRQKSFTSRLEQYNNFTQNSLGVTNQYDGEQIQSTIQTQQNVKYYNMRASFAPQAKKKLDKMLLELNAKTIDIPNSRRQKQLNFKQIKEMQLPLFPVPKRQQPQMNEIKNYKLFEYKKHFGHKYSRLDEYSKIINLSTINYEQNKDEVFSERKHLKDSSSFSQQLSKVNNSLHYSRKLALPRLNGKYKVLDRYQST